MASIALALGSNNYTVSEWHAGTRCEEGDVNALFQYEGVWHLMQQWHARPLTSVGHTVSPTLLRWHRVKDVLSARPQAVNT